MKLTTLEKKHLQGRVTFSRIPFNYVSSVGIEKPDGTVVMCKNYTEYVDFIKENKLFQADLKVVITWNNYKIDKLIDPFLDSIII